MAEEPISCSRPVSIIQSDGTSAMTQRVAKQVTVNLESVIILENKLSRVFNNVKSIKQLNMTAN